VVVFKVRFCSFNFSFFFSEVRALLERSLSVADDVYVLGAFNRGGIVK